MPAVSGPARYFFLHSTRGQEDVQHWPPLVKPLEAPENVICTAVRLYPDNTSWRAECDAGENGGQRAGATDQHLVLTRRTIIGLVGEGRRGRAEVGLLGVRVVNPGKGAEYATHLIVAALPGSGLGPRRPVVVPIGALVLGEYVEQGDYAEAALDLRITQGEYAGMPQYLPDDVIRRNAQHALDMSIQNQRARHGFTLEVEAGRVAMYGQAELDSFGAMARDVLLATPGVVEVADNLLYGEELKGQVEDALAAKGLGSIVVLVEHNLVNLRGEAPDSKTRYQAEDIAKRIPGVRGVVNDIVVTSAVAR